ncbi:MAG: lipase family alpha/beta hydrolase [Chthoniobacterales bacterium]
MTTPPPGSKAPSSLRKKILWWTAAAALLAFFLLRAAMQYSANQGVNDPVQFEFFGNPDSKHLIVVIHAYQGSKEKMAEVRQAIQEEHTDAEIMMVQYPPGTFSNADCFQISSKLCEHIDLCYREKPGHYERIDFVGYSMGALLARKSYVYACGKIEDLNPDPEAAPSVRPAYEWATNGTVKRFVLFAGMNRGWSVRNRPSGMSLWHQSLYTAGKFIGWATDTGRLALQCETGEPFVANLRLQWLDVMREPGFVRPTVIQLLGDTDDIVSSEDSRDVNVSKEFIWVQLAGTNHFNATKFHDGLDTAEEQEFGRARKEKFNEALGDDEAIEQLRRASPQSPEADDNNIVEAVVVLHGIRDYGEWTTEFENELQKRFMKTHAPPDKLCIYRPKYGYFPMGRFLLWPERQKKVRWFMDEMTELQARYPCLKRINFIGHSNGTYILASTLRKYKALKNVKRVVFAGSVVRQNFDWTSPVLASRVETVRAYAGSADWVVGWFPRLFEIWPFTALGNDIGSAGFNGFTKPATMSESAWQNLEQTFLFQTKYVKGGHGTAIEAHPDKIDSIASFVMDPSPTKVDPSNNEISCTQEWPFRLTSAVAPIVWLIIVRTVIAGWILVGNFPNWFKQKVIARHPAHRGG